MNLIFAIPENKREATAAYLELVDHIEGSSHGTLSGNSSNIVDIIKDNYQVADYTIHYIGNCIESETVSLKHTYCLGIYFLHYGYIFPYLIRPPGMCTV